MCNSVHDCPYGLTTHSHKTVALVLALNVLVLLHDSPSSSRTHSRETASLFVVDALNEQFSEFKNLKLKDCYGH
jgi:uncharacterized secreted protein with C-terminal beta-propeller domain